MSAKTSSRTRQILDKKRKLLGQWASYAVWREDLGLAELVQRKGKTWHNMGLQVKEHFFCNLIEAAFMSERCNLIVSKDGRLLSVKDHFALLVLNEITWQSYFSYVFLKRAGYSLFCKPASWLNENVDGSKLREATTTKKREAEAEAEAEPQEQAPEAAAPALNFRPTKRRRVGGDSRKEEEAEAAAPGGEGRSREWWEPADSMASWLGCAGPPPSLPSNAFGPLVLDSKTEAFPNLRSFGKKDSFSLDLEEPSLHAFEVKLISGNTPGRKKKADFLLHVPKRNSIGLTWKQAHHVSNLSKRDNTKPAKVSFIDGASVCFFSVHNAIEHPMY